MEREAGQRRERLEKREISPSKREREKGVLQVGKGGNRCQNGTMERKRYRETISREILRRLRGKREEEKMGNST